MCTRFRHPEFALPLTLTQIEAEALFRFGVAEKCWLPCEKPGYWNGYAVTNMQHTIHNIDVAFPERRLKARSIAAVEAFFKQCARV